MSMLKALFFSTCIFLSEILSAGSNDASDSYSNALRIFSEGRYFEASIEFERAIFYESDSSRIPEYRYYKSLCYKGLADYGRAIEELQRIKMDIVPDSLTTLIGYEKAMCFFLRNEVSQALTEIEGIRSRINDTLRLIDIIPLNILLLNASWRWEEALSLWNYFIENSDLHDSVKCAVREDIIQLYKEENMPRYYSPAKAERLSGIIPGSGQMYCGAIGEGSFNFLINASLIAFSAWEFYTRYYFTGYFIGLRLFNKFYSGGVRRAGLLAKEKNREGIRNFNSENSYLMLMISESGNSLNR